MRIAISVGHGKYIRGASASPRPPYLDEVDEAVKVVDRLHKLWTDAGVGCVKFFDTTSTSQSQNLSTINAWHNSQQRDYDVSCHFNAYQVTSKAMGTEVLYVTQQQLAADVSYAIAKAGGFINRGAKKRTDLSFLNGTNKPAILLEVCFVDSSADADLYRRNFDAICRAAAEAIAKVSIGTEPPVEPPEPETPPPDQTAAHVDITIKTSGAPVIVTINGQDFQFDTESPESPDQVKPVFPPNQSNIICTVFGGASDPNNSAYPPYDVITDSEISCSLPAKFVADERPRVEVMNVANGKTVTCNIRDVGPWFTDDPYWLGHQRPRAEPAGSTIKGGPNNGKKSNGAGLDLTPGAAKAIGLEGKGMVNWAFAREEPIA